MPAGRTQTLVAEASVVLLNVIAARRSFGAAGSTESWRSSRYFAASWLARAGGDRPVRASTCSDGRSGSPIARRRVPALPDPRARRRSRGVQGRTSLSRIAARSRSTPRLIAASLAAIGYALIRPVGADGRRVAVRGDVRHRGGHAVRRVRRPGALGALAGTSLAVAGAHGRVRRHARVRLGMDARDVRRGLPRHRDRVHGRRTGAGDDHGLVPSPGGLRARTADACTWCARSSRASPWSRRARRSSPSATLDDARGLSAVQSAAIIAVLGIGVAARILANQIRSTQAHADARRALSDKERALSEADSPWSAFARRTRRSANPRSISVWSSRRPWTGSSSWTTAT